MTATKNLAAQVIKRNNVNIAGQGQKVLVFAHGFGCDQYVWDQIAPAFEEKYRVVLFDYVGSGKSDKTAYNRERYRTLHGYKKDLLELCDALSLENIVFIGHSVSSMIGALAAVERPELMKNLIMIGPSPYFLSEPGYQGGFEKEDLEGMLRMIEGDYNEFARFLSPLVMQNASRPHLAAEFEQLLCSNDAEVLRDFAEATFLSDVRAELEKVAVPTLILQSQNDAVASEAVGEYVHSRIKNSEYRLLDAEGHSPHVSDADEIIKKIWAYLSVS
ncbi:sigma factor sigB regulation protein rsbQ [Planococcus salinarum]|uniref:Sigma factor sigB regulation protein rsbQ n=1 Tax=Planococcus salinarum TaxID=622695 RepID=A0ABX3D194_9BACL|nr:alpha/beta hydrolase [Planococcus salinarum]OHX51136.1 sigma factor sigB regulation protein rsbQ [Planococcus salinarum]